mmetsp:Transcript_31081/g.94038  ORF Transcript_31081/g.94038 Transcript_31081/m.94038 type:complete len:121 (-) Transcript_31081:209-571(-)
MQHHAVFRGSLHSSGLPLQMYGLAVVVVHPIPCHSQHHDRLMSDQLAISPTRQWKNVEVDVVRVTVFVLVEVYVRVECVCVTLVLVYVHDVVVQVSVVDKVDVVPVRVLDVHVMVTEVVV